MSNIPEEVWPAIIMIVLIGGGALIAYLIHWGMMSDCIDHGYNWVKSNCVENYR